MECALIQSATADNTEVTRRSKANKCGSHRMGWTGSSAILSLINCDSGFGPFWNLKPSCKHSKMWFAYHSPIPPPHTPLPVHNPNVLKHNSGQKRKFYLNNAFNVESRTIQHCTNGAKLLNSSYWLRPKPLPIVWQHNHHQHHQIKESKHLKIGKVR